MGDIGPPLDGDKNNHLSIPPPASPWIDTVYLYPARYKTWYVGAGAIVDLDSGFMPTEDLHCAHLRSANPWYLPDHEKLKHFHDRRAWQLFTNDYGTWDDPRLWEQAEMDSESQFEKRTEEGDTVSKAARSVHVDRRIRLYPVHAGYAEAIEEMDKIRFNLSGRDENQHTPIQGL